MALGIELKGQPKEPCTESLYHTANAMFPGWSTPLLTATAWDVWADSGGVSD